MQVQRCLQALSTHACACLLAHACRLGACLEEQGGWEGRLFGAKRGNQE